MNEQEYRRMRDADPTAFSDLLKQFVKSRGWESGLNLAKLREAWPTLVGSALGNRSLPTKLDKDGTLTISCTDGTVASETRILGESIAKGCNDLLGSKQVKSVKTESVARKSRRRNG